MKCDNCGKNEVNFHYTSNINGNITEKHLCAECAAKLGYQERSGYRADMSLDEIFSELFGMGTDKRIPGGYGVMFPTFVIPTVGMIFGNSAPDAPQAEAVPEIKPEDKPEVDAEMSRRREVNILREQMKQAAEAEDFEKAASLRDRIRELEGGESK